MALKKKKEKKKLCHVLGTTLMSEKFKSISFNYLKASIRGYLPGARMGDPKIPWMVGRKKHSIPSDNEYIAANLPLTPKCFYLGPKKA